MSDVHNLAENTRKAFSAVKSDMMNMKDQIKEQREMILKLNENQKALLTRLRDAEMKLLEKKAKKTKSSKAKKE